VFLEQTKIRKQLDGKKSARVLLYHTIPEQTFHHVSIQEAP